MASRLTGVLFALTALLYAGCAADARDAVDDVDTHHDDVEDGDSSEDPLAPGVAVPGSLGLNRDHTFYLTFDDGPSTTYTPHVLDVLKKHGAHATFFLTGSRIAEASDIVRREHAEGHNVGNHQWIHEQASPSQFEAWVPRERDLIDQVLGERVPRLFRYPYGAGTVAKEEMVRGYGYKDGGIGWHVDSLDWCYGAKGVCKRATPAYRSNYVEWVLSECKRMGGGVILMHDIQGITSSHLDEIMTTLEQRGYKFGELPREGR